MNLSMVRGLTLSLLGCFVVHASLEFILVCLSENFSFERRNSTVCIICLGAETQTAKDLINKSQYCHHENEISSL